MAAPSSVVGGLWHHPCARECGEVEAADQGRSCGDARQREGKGERENAVLKPYDTPRCWERWEIEETGMASPLSIRVQERAAGPEKEKRRKGRRGRWMVDSKN